MSKNPERSNDDNYETVMQIAMIVAANLAASVKNIADSNEYVQEFTKSLNSDTKLAAASIAINIPTLEVGRPYKTAEFMKIVEKYFESISPTQMSRALIDLTRQFRFEHLVGKENIKKISIGKGRIQFTGRPSIYLLPSEVASIKRVYENKNHVDKILNILKKSGILHLYLEKTMPATLRLIKNDTNGKYREFASSLFPSLALDREGWANFKSILSALNETQLELSAQKMIEVLENKITDIPGLGRAIMVSAFTKLESIDQ